MFGTVLENVVLDRPPKKVRFADQSITENTRASYPLTTFATSSKGGARWSSKNVVFLTADGISEYCRQLRAHPASRRCTTSFGYTAKIAGTELGVKEPSHLQCVLRGGVSSSGTRRK